jgi:hypothetical protein
MSKWGRRMLGLVNLVATWRKDPRYVEARQ